MSKTAIIIPCYNEALRLDESKVNELLQKSDCAIFFANDGSKDDTVGVINKIRERETHTHTPIVFCSIIKKMKAKPIRFTKRSTTSTHSMFTTI